MLLGLGLYYLGSVRRWREGRKEIRYYSLRGFMRSKASTPANRAKQGQALSSALRGTAPSPPPRPSNAFRPLPKAGSSTPDSNLMRIQEQRAHSVRSRGEKTPPVSTGSPEWRDPAPGVKFKLPAGSWYRASAHQRSRNTA